MEDTFAYFKKAPGYFLVFLKWLLISCVTGLAVGGAGVLLNYVIQYVTNIRVKYGFIILLLPVCGIVISFLYSAAKTDDKGTNLVITAIRSSDKIPIKTAPLVFIGTVLTHLSGGSAGREGAALQIGGSLAAQFGRWLRLDEKDEKIITMCGMSAGFAALFGTPAAACVFSMELISVGVMYYAAFVPCIISAVMGYYLFTLCKFAPPHFTLGGIPDLSFKSFAVIIILGALCAVLSAVFCGLLNGSSRLYEKLLPNRYLRIAAGGVLLIIVTYLFNTRDYNGAGIDVINRALSGDARPEAFLLKMLFTAITLGAGYKGGEIIPALFTGAVFGAFAGNFLFLDPSFAASVGMICVFCGVTNCPMTSLVLSAEMFGTSGFIFFAAATAVSYMLSGYSGLYKAQKIVYSKVRPEFIDKTVREANRDGQ